MAAEYLKKHGFDLNAEVDKVNFGGNAKPPVEEAVDPKLLQSIIGVKLPRQHYLWDIQVSAGKISSIDPHNFNSPIHHKSPSVLEARGCLIAPSLCHAHIHLDKCFLLQDSKFSDLEIVDGDFKEAMALTTAAKKRFTRSDLLRRGRQLIIESIQHGVTHMRAFVEVDRDVGMKCLDAGLQLKKEFSGRCEVQICAFAQLPIFSGDDNGEEVRRSMQEASRKDGVDVLGSTPYVEDEESKERKKVEWLIDLALESGKLLDFHLDYHLDESKKACAWDVLDAVKAKNWLTKGGKNITLGNCTRLTHFTYAEWTQLKEVIADLPISFVGLPTSDLFMMRTEQRYRGSLHVPDMIQKHKLQAAIAVNNIGNAFTPQGNCDPLAIASLGVGLYSAGTKADTELLYECVSTRAKQVIGLPGPGLAIKVGDPADFVIFEKSYTKIRSRKTISEVVYDPPAARITIKGGVITSR